MPTSPRPLIAHRPAVVAAALLALASASAGAQAPPTAPTASSRSSWEMLQAQLAQLQQQLSQLAADNRSLREHQQQLEQQVAQLAAAGHTTSAASARTGASPARVAGAGGAPLPAQPANASALPDSSLPASSPVASATTGAASGITSVGAGLRLWGYGEVYYSHPTRVPDGTQADLARAVFGIGYRFDERTEFNSEYEVEHAIASSSDAGEFEVEQFYVDRGLTDSLSLRLGLFLMPFGFINEHHEPTQFYGVQRNFIETLIIPSTWREGGLALRGNTASGLGWSAGVTTGFDLAKWDFAPEFPLYSTALDLGNSDASPLRTTHQELALANAHDLSQYLALGYYGVPGFSAGAAIFSGNAVGVPAPPNSPQSGKPRVTLWEGHLRWTPGRWDLSALYTHGAISNTALANAANPGSPNPIPASFYGYFFQSAYDLWQRGDYRLAPFARFERYNLGASYAGTAGPDLPRIEVPLSGNPGDYGFWPQNHDRVWTVGANFYLGPHVVLKGDYQWFNVNPDLRRFDLGLGVTF